MSSTEPPSRIPPREGGHESKAAREELSSKGKVEKVREVDPDEETRKKKFLKYYRDEGAEETVTEERPSPFDLYADGGPNKEKKGLGSSKTSFSDAENAVVPGPSYSSPPDVSQEETEDDEEELGGNSPLPQAEGFWEEVTLPDQPLPEENNYQETPNSKNKSFADSLQMPYDQEDENIGMVSGKGAPKKKGEEQLTKKEEEILLQGLTPEEKKIEHEKLIRQKKKKKVEQVSRQKKTKEELKKAKSEEERGDFLTRPTRKEEELAPRVRKHKKQKEVKEELEALPLPSLKPEERVTEVKGQTKREAHIVEIESPSTPPLPSQVVPMAQTAVTQAAHYLHPTTVSLFYQMVGTIYIMQNSGVSRTEITLNNPSYSGSKFFGSTITIEKYTTAPDSFNIRLTGSNEAVLAFKENIPSLMTSFSNSNLPFRINRLDAEYTMEKPIFRRKERKDRGDAGGSDLGEKRR